MYVKLAELDGIQLFGHFIMVDEAQDLSPVMISIIRQQKHMQVIAVGDNAQSINRWMGSVSLLKHMSHAQKCQLSESFRFGPEIADVANEILDLLPTGMRLEGKGGPSKVTMLDNPSCWLFRGNAGTVSQALVELSKNRKFHITGDVSGIVRFCEGVRDLQAGQRSFHPDLATFETFAEFEKYVETDEGASDLKLMVKLIEDHGVEKIINALGLQTTMKKADVVLSTAHKTKGMAFDTVALGPDFAPLHESGEDELMLLYVAVTRAKKALDISLVDFGDDDTQDAADGATRQTYSISDIRPANA